MCFWRNSKRSLRGFALILTGATLLRGLGQGLTTLVTLGRAALLICAEHVSSDANTQSTWVVVGHILLISIDCPIDLTDFTAIWTLL